MYYGIIVFVYLNELRKCIKIPLFSPNRSFPGNFCYKQYHTINSCWNTNCICLFCMEHIQIIILQNISSTLNLYHEETSSSWHLEYIIIMNTILFKVISYLFDLDLTRLRNVKVTGPRCNLLNLASASLCVKPVTVKPFTSKISSPEKIKSNLKYKNI